MLMTVDIKGHLEQMLGQADATAKLPDPVTEWCMVLVRPGGEQEARDSLRRRGVGAWWPNYTIEIGYKDRMTGKRMKRAMFTPVLPGILLSPARLNDNFWRAIDLSPCVINVVRKYNADVVLLSEIDIVLIHKIEAELNRSTPPAGTHSYQVGDKVRLLADDLRRLPAGEVIKCWASGHIEVEVNFMGALRPMKLLPSQIEPVDQKGRIKAKANSTDARDRPAKSPSARKAG